MCDYILRIDEQAAGVNSSVWEDCILDRVIRKKTH